MPRTSTRLWGAAATASGGRAVMKLRSPQEEITEGSMTHEPDGEPRLDDERATRYFDRSGLEISHEQLLIHLAERNYRHVARTETSCIEVFTIRRAWSKDRCSSLRRCSRRWSCRAPTSRCWSPPPPPRRKRKTPTGGWCTTSSTVRTVRRASSSAMTAIRPPSNGSAKPGGGRSPGQGRAASVTSSNTLPCWSTALSSSESARTRTSTKWWVAHETAVKSSRPVERTRAAAPVTM